MHRDACETSPDGRRERLWLASIFATCRKCPKAVGSARATRRTSPPTGSRWCRCPRPPVRHTAADAGEGWGRVMRTRLWGEAAVVRRRFSLSPAPASRLSRVRNAQANDACKQRQRRRRGTKPPPSAQRPGATSPTTQPWLANTPCLTPSRPALSGSFPAAPPPKGTSC